MKKTIFTFILLSLFCFSYAQEKANFEFSFDRTTINILNSSDSGLFLKNTSSILLIEDQNFTQETSYDPSLFRPLSDFGMIIAENDYYNNGILDINFWDIGKPIYQFNSEVYSNDLSRYIQRPPDIMLLCPIQ